jgi:hypothetical protein
MKCPHCLIGFRPKWEEVPLGNDRYYSWKLAKQICPDCEKFLFKLVQSDIVHIQGTAHHKLELIVYPKKTSRSPLSSDVPAKFADDYNEACLVLADSPKACAALGRRCLQNIIREKAGIGKGDLYHEIQELLDSNQLPPYLARYVDAVRTIGNFATHPLKNTNSGEIIEVEPGEAEWTLDVLEGLFQFYFIQPAESERKRNALNAKLADAGKPPITQPPPSDNSTTKD